MSKTKRGTKKVVEEPIDLSDEVSDEQSDDEVAPPPAKKGRKKKEEPSSSTDAAKKKSKPKKKKEELTEDEKNRNKAFHKFMSRKGPQELGLKKFPIGKPGCFENLSFVVTGVMEGFKRDTFEDEIKKYGGRVQKAISKTTDYLVMGRDCGETKKAKADKVGTKKVTEDEFLDMLRATNPEANKEEKKEEANGKSKYSSDISDEDDDDDEDNDDSGGDDDDEDD